MFRLRLRSVIVLALIYIYFSYSNALNSGKKGRYEVFLESEQRCKDPRPPYTKRLRIISKCSINVINGKRYISGNISTRAPVQFQNFSARTFSIEAGKRALKFQVSQVTCRNIIIRTLIAFVNMNVSMRNCMLMKGFYQYDNLDLDKISHALPNWHAPGEFVHEMQLVTNGTTETCHEIKVKIIDLD